MDQNLNQLQESKPIDYLLIGHITADLTDDGICLGGTAAFSGLTAQALGMQTGVVTSHADDLDTTPLKGLWLKNKASQYTTTFKNISDGVHRTQYLYHVAETLKPSDLPIINPPPAIIHLGPVANEVDPAILQHYSHSLKCLTPQGWFRGIDKTNKVVPQMWEAWEQTFEQADIAVISQDDVQKDEDRIAKMATAIPILVVTENFKGARVYWHNDARYIHAPEVKYGDDTGAGDIFATAFFYRYLWTKDPWEAGRFAVLLASWSVTRKHLDSIPTAEEISQAKMELFEN